MDEYNGSKKTRANIKLNKYRNTMKKERKSSLSIFSYFSSAATGLVVDTVILFGLTSIGISVSYSQLISGTIGALVLYFLESTAIKNKYTYMWAWVGYQSIWIFCQAWIISIINEITSGLLVAKLIVAGTSFVTGFIVLKCISIISKL